MKKIIILLSIICSLLSFSYWEDFVIIPSWASWWWWIWWAIWWAMYWQQVKEIWKEWGKVWEKYEVNAQAMEADLWWQFATWIMTWNTLINYARYLVNFMSQMALVMWALMIVYAWYLFWMWVYLSDTQKWKSAIKNALIWVFIVIFSYAIMKILTWAFLLQ